MCFTRLEKVPSVKFTKAGGKAPVKLSRSNLSQRGKFSTKLLTEFCFRGKTEKEMNNLRQEIEILKGLYHENIILLLDSFETTHEFCVVTEFAQGELFEILEDDRNLGEPEVRKIAQ